MIAPGKPIGQIIIETDLSTSDMTLSNGKTGRPIKEVGGHLVVESIFQAANRLNRNKRKYKDAELASQISDPRQQELIRTGNLKSENGHPMSKDLARQQTIDPNNTVAVICKLWMEGDLVKGWAYGDFNQKGDDFDRQVRNGQYASWSLRALGTLVPTKEGTEVRGLKIITYDRVHYPSHPEAYMQGFVYESAFLEKQQELCQEGSRLIIPKDDPGIIIPITNESVINYIKTESANIKYLKEDFDFAYDNVELIKNPVTKSSSVKLTDKEGSILVVDLESYIMDDIMNYCISK